MRCGYCLKFLKNKIEIIFELFFDLSAAVVMGSVF